MHRPAAPAAPGGFILLDEEQERTLRSERVMARPHPRQGSLGGVSNGSDRTRNRNDQQQPRTNFTSSGDPAHMLQLPPAKDRHNTSVATNNSGGATQRSESFGTYTGTSSPRTNFTSRLQGGLHPDFAIARASEGSSGDETDSNGNDPRNHYAGNSSNLRLSVTYTIAGVVIGLGLGILLATLEVSTLAADWIALPGTLFLRALKCLVVPYVFCSVAVAIGDIVFVGKVSVVGFQTVKVFLIFWITTNCLGMGIALAFRPLFRLNTAYESTATNSVGFTCENGNMLEMLTNGSVACASNATTTAGTHAFTVDDVNDVFSKNEDSSLSTLTLSAQIIEILDSLVPANIFSSMSDATLLSIITFAMVFGAIAGRSYFTKTRNVNFLYLVLLQMRNTLFLGMEWIIWLSPVAVVFIVAGSFAANQDSVSQFGDVYLFVLANLLAAVLQMGLLLPFIVFVMTRCNPFNHMYHMTRAYLFSFGCASSLATAPVTLACIKKGKVCSQSLANFVISVGVVADLSSLGFYCPITMVFLAESSGNGDQITTVRIVVIFLLSLLASMGTPPIPSAGQVLMATMYQTVFGVSDLPTTWTLFVAMDFFCDRIATVINVNDDIMALKIIAENTDETILGDHLGERF